MTSYRTKEQAGQNTLSSPGAALELSIRVALTAETLAKVRAIGDYDLWFVAERLRGDGFSDQQAESGVAELKKYMALFALGYEELGMISREVDEAWHSFILFTEEYTKFCQSIFGRYIHHAPNTSRSPHLSRKCVINFADAYTQVFGPLPGIWDSEALKATLAIGTLATGECSVAPKVPHVEDVAVGYSAAGDCGAVDYPACNGHSER